MLADEFEKKIEIVHAADDVAEEPVYEDDDDGPRRAPARGHDHGPRRPRQDLAARRHPRDRGGRGRGGRHHPAHRRLPGAPRRQHDHLPRHPRPPGLHRHARPRRPGHRHRGHRGGGRRRRHAADARGHRPRHARPRCRCSWRSTRSTRRARTPTACAASWPAWASRPPTGAATPSSSTSRPRPARASTDLLENLVTLADLQELRSNPDSRGVGHASSSRGSTRAAGPVVRARPARHAQGRRRARGRRPLGPRAGDARLPRRRA